MARDTITDGTRIGQLLSSEIHGHEGGLLGHLTVVDANTDVEPAADGAFAYGIDISETANGRIASAYVHPDRLRLEFETAVETAFKATERAGLCARPKAIDPPRAIVFVESGAEVKDALGVLRAVVKDRLDSPE
ncbi:MAG: hypothetical protein V5A36_02845 [Natronomonas sp.]